jgi:hypothetical protein
MRNSQLSCPYCRSILHVSADQALGTPVSCLVCGRTFIAADDPAPTAPGPAAAAGALPTAMPPTAMPPSNGRALLLSGFVFAALALLLIGGMGIGLWLTFGPRTQVAEVDPAPAPNVATTPVRTPEPDPISDRRPPEIVPPSDKRDQGDDLDLADLKKHDTPQSRDPVASRINRNSEPVAPPTVPVNVPAAKMPDAWQQRVDTAIDKGVRYLKQALANGDGRRTFEILRQRIEADMGFTALAGLTLLECKVPANDPTVLRAAAVVRNRVDSLSPIVENYQLSLAILFLDRLGDPQDEGLIQRLALRLLAGQNTAGGWSYTNQYPLSPPEMQKLLVFLKSHRPPTPLPKVLARDPAAPRMEVTQKKDTKGMTAITGKGQTAPKREPPAKKVPPMPLQNLPQGLQGLAVARLSAAKGRLTLDMPRGEDNSNTQFALLGLWAARRHDVPTEYSLQHAQRRFAKFQNEDGGWGYLTYRKTKDTMTCAGLIGLAMGHGVSADLGKDKAKRDPAIQKGLSSLGRAVGKPGPPNLYFLWSVERVAMLYDLKTIGGKDWYAWGSKTLLANQQADGSWTDGQYPGANDFSDSCFALLFLKRSNLVPDLTENLRLFMVIRDPEAK